MTVSSPKSALASVSAPPEHETIAAIDIGSNSIHLVVARIGSSGSISVIDADKATVRLVEGIGSDGNLTGEAIRRVVEAVRHMKEIAAAYQCRIRAVATHATREAANCDYLTQEVERATGIAVEVIDGTEEARLAYLGMRFGLSLGRHLCLGIDIGGGSTELIVARAENIKVATSIKLGAVAITKKYFGSGAPTLAAIRTVKEVIRQRMAPVLPVLGRFQPDKVIGSSGTVKALAIMHSAMRGHKLVDASGYAMTRAELSAIVEKLEELRTPKRIKEYFDIDGARADIILAGALVLHSLAELLQLDAVTVSTFGLREGLVVDTYRRSHGWTHGDTHDVRWHSVRDLARRLHVDEDHSRHVSTLAVEIFDQLAPKLFPDQGELANLETRELLRGAAYLYEAGKFLSHPRYHKHSAYLIMNSSLMGYTQNERRLMGLIARYHRKNHAALSDPEVVGLHVREVEKVNVLAAILRLAAAMDRTRQRKIDEVAVEVSDRRADVVMRYHGAGFPDVEMDKAKRETATFTKAFGLELYFRAEKPRRR